MCAGFVDVDFSSSGLGEAGRSFSGKERYGRRDASGVESSASGDGEGDSFLFRAVLMVVVAGLVGDGDFRSSGLGETDDSGTGFASGVEGSASRGNFLLLDSAVAGLGSVGFCSVRLAEEASRSLSCKCARFWQRLVVRSHIRFVS